MRVTDLDRARAAIEHGEFRQALALLDGLGGADTSPDALELRAQAAYGSGEFEACIAAWEALHALLVARGDDVGAARAAAMIAMYLMIDTGLMAPVRGWLRRAERLLAGHDETPAHAVIAMVRTYERFMCGDMEASRRHAEAAIDLGGRLGVLPAVVVGRTAAARLRILAGDVAEGLDLLDEVGTLLMSGEVDPLTTGMMYCELICAAQGLALYDRASEWTDVMEHWRQGAAFGGINGRCRVHRAEMLRVSGPCDVAEEEALKACSELRPWMRREFGWPLAELGNIRLRKGDLDGAEEAFLAAHDHSWSAQPGLALLHLARGDGATAAALIADAIAHPFDIPSKERPPFGDLRLAPLLDAQAEIAAATGDAATARRAADSLQAIADSYHSRSLHAGASLARARAALLEGDFDDAITLGHASVVEWADLHAPFETAQARMVLADACHRAGHHDRARMEWRAAHAAFDEFGAVGRARDAARLADGAGEVPVPHRPPATTSAQRPTSATAVFRCTGDTRTVDFGGTAVTVRDLQGFRYVERLLADPGREFHVLDLVAAERGSPPAGEHGGGRPGDVGLLLIDDQAREAYRRRLAEVDDDIEEATRLNDLRRIELAERDRDYLVAELARAVGIGGRTRTTGGHAERARTSVTRSIRYALARLDEHHPAVARHLSACVHTGTYCVYHPDPLAAVEWVL